MIFDNIGDGNAYGLIFGNDDFAVADKDVVGVNVNIVVDVAVQFDNGAAAELQQLLYPEIGSTERYRDVNGNFISG